jgi:hypothetical protein
MYIHTYDIHSRRVCVSVNPRIHSRSILHTYIHTCTHTYRRLCVCVCVCVCVCMCVSVCVRGVGCRVRGRRGFIIDQRGTSHGARRLQCAAVGLCPPRRATCYLSIKLLSPPGTPLLPTLRLGRLQARTQKISTPEFSARELGGRGRRV